MSGQRHNIVVLSLRVFAAIAIACWFGSTAQADDTSPTSDSISAIERARLHYQAGEKLYLLGRYPDALREFQDGYALAPRPEFLLNLGQVQRKLGDRASAITMFENFLLTTSPDDSRRLAVEDILKELRAEPAVSTADTPVVAVPSVRIAAAVYVDRKPWYRDWLGGTLTSAGLVGVTVGTGLFVSANARIGDAQMDLDSYFGARDALTTRTIGLTLLGAGSALVIGGVIRYVTYHR